MTYGYIIECRPGETHETIGSEKLFHTVVRRVTVRADGWGEDRSIARFYGRTATCARVAAERFCTREYGGIGTDPLLPT